MDATFSVNVFATTRRIAAWCRAVTSSAVAALAMPRLQWSGLTE